MFDRMLCPNRLTSRIDDAIASLEADATDAAIVGLLSTDIDPLLPDGETLTLLVRLRRRGVPLLEKIGDPAEELGVEVNRALVPRETGSDGALDLLQRVVGVGTRQIEKDLGDAGERLAALLQRTNGVGEGRLCRLSADR